ncbi:MAG TPA: MerR family transcriptional regulator [Acidobacteriota bacterium]
MAKKTIPDKLFFKIGEVSELTETEPYVLRYWETEFSPLLPAKNKSGQRIYKKSDIEMIQKIKHLLYEEGFTIAGAKKRLAEEMHARFDQSRSKREEIRDRLVTLRGSLREILTLMGQTDRNSPVGTGSTVGTKSPAGTKSSSGGT